jgi:hypothetical protein
LFVAGRYGSGGHTEWGASGRPTTRDLGAGARGWDQDFLIFSYIGGRNRAGAYFFGSRMNW